MAHATLRTDGHAVTDGPGLSAEHVLGQIQRLFHELQALPGANEAGARGKSLAYTSLAARIRGYSERYTALTA